MPFIIPYGFGFTHMQVYTNSIGMAEVNVTAFHFGPIYTGVDRFVLVSVIKKVLLRAVPRYEFVVVSKKRQEMSHGIFPRGYSFEADMLRLAEPNSWPDQVHYLVNNLQSILKKDDENAAAAATYSNPYHFSDWNSSIVSAVTDLLRRGLCVVQLPRKPGIAGCISRRPCEKRKGRSREKKSEMIEIFVGKRNKRKTRSYGFRGAQIST